MTDHRRKRAGPLSQDSLAEVEQAAEPLTSTDAADGGGRIAGGEGDDAAQTMPEPNAQHAVLGAQVLDRFALPQRPIQPATSPTGPPPATLARASRRRSKTSTFLATS
jgi:hypothetical protein